MIGESVAERRKKVFVGELPDDFLRLTLPSSSGAPADVDGRPIVVQFAQSQPLSFVPPNTRGRIQVTIMEANLVKNYGLVRMDPYCRVRVGNSTFETPTKISAGRQPVWNRVVHAYLPNNVESIYVQIFDEKAFSQDECVAWAHVMLPCGIFANETIEDWFPLSGQQGEGQEGMIHLSFSFHPLQNPAVQEPQPQFQPVVIKDEDIKELKEMFATVDEEVIRSILEQHHGDKNGACNALLEMMS